MDTTIDVYISSYILCVIITLSVLVLKFNTVIVLHLFELFGILPKDKYFTMEDIQEALEKKYLTKPWLKSLIPELWACPICLGTWVGLIVSIVISLLTGAYYLPLIMILGSQVFVAVAMKLEIIDH